MGNQSNGIFSTLIKTIFILLGVYIIAINITLWATSQGVGVEQLGAKFPFTFADYHETKMSQFGYVGFEKFYDILSTFPGLRYCQGVTSTYANIVTGYSVTHNGVLDLVLAIFRILTTPLLLSVTIVADIVNNVIWFLGFLNIVPGTPQGSFLS